MPKALALLLSLACATWAPALQTAAAQVTLGIRADTTLPDEDTWIAQTLVALSPAQRIGQLFVARAHSDGSAGSLVDIRRLVTEQGVGGVCFFQGTPAEQVAWTNDLQGAAAVPLLISQDAEWGPAMRFPDELKRLPYALTLGAANDTALTRAIGRESGRQLRRLGVHVSFAPVADLNADPANPVIGRRSFGESPTAVGRLASAYARGLRDEGILAVAKHFPGHGDTDVDSHVALPVLRADRARLDSVELVPFRMLTQDGVAGVMTGHLAVPALDARADRPASLSGALSQNLLRAEWDYDGLVVTDGLDMAAVTTHYPDGEAAVEALLAGNDVLLVPQDIPAGIAAIEAAVAEGRVSRERIDASVRRLLRAKYRAGLARPSRPIATTDLLPELNTPHVRALNERAYRRAVTVLAEGPTPIPFVEVDRGRTAAVSLGTGRLTDFQRTAARYAPVVQPLVDAELDSAGLVKWTRELSTFDRVLVGLHGLNWRPSEGFGVDTAALRLLSAIAPQTELTVVIFGSPYVVDRLFDLDAALLVAYEDVPLAHKAAAEVLYGAVGGLGVLPVTAAPSYTAGTGLLTAPAFRLAYSEPENAGFDASRLREIDRLMREAIRTKATPGGVVLGAHDGHVGYLEAFGKQTYDLNADPVDVNTVYDLASITKVAAATISVMRLHEEGLISVYDPIGEHLPWLANTNKANLKIHDIIAHRARLKPWIPFYKSTFEVDAKGKSTTKYKSGVYASSPRAGTSTPVSGGFYIRNDYRDTILTKIAESELRTRPGYKYSDLGFYIMAELVREKTGMPLEEYVSLNFYRPMGLRNIGYRPTERLPATLIPPSEDDKYWRRARVQGYVHDMGAAMLGGVSGHAGLFANAPDLAALAQMLLNGGVYGGRRYFKEETIRLFTTRHPKDTRRGLGWDMVQTRPGAKLNMSPLASASTFGHLGFTGTAMWADPETGVLFIVLTNRTFPSMERNAWHKEEYRPRLQGALYEALR